MLELNNSAVFYEEVHKALWGYISDKLNMPIATLNLENSTEKLLSIGIGNEMVEEFKAIIESCEYARFSPNAEHSQMADLYNKTFSLIEGIEDLLKRKSKK